MTHHILLSVTLQELLTRWMLVWGMLFLRYTLVAGAFFLVFYVFWKQRWQHKRIQPKFPKQSQYRQEFLYSLATMCVFACVASLIFIVRKNGLTRIYYDIADLGWWYWGASILVAIVLHDTYFYWTHRLMHHPWLFKWVHRVHHESHNPSPWAAFSFHPLEAVLEAGILPLLVFTVPLHWSALFIFLLYMMVMNVIGHLGYEIFPKGMHGHMLGRWQNSSTHHNMHHHFVHYNFGLYFNWWDTWMKTNHPKYFETYDKMTVKKPENQTVVNI